MLKEGRPTEYRLQTLVNKCGTDGRADGEKERIKIVLSEGKAQCNGGFRAAGGKEVKGMLVSSSKIRN